MSFYTTLKNRTKLIRKRPLYRAKIWLKYCLNQEKKDPVFILTTRRSGSNLLLDYLKSIPSASFQAEILNAKMLYGIRHHFISKKAALRHIAHSINYSQHRLCGAKLISSQLETHGIVPDDLKGIFPSARFIILYRESLLDQFISLKIAEKTKVWQWIDSGFVLPHSIDINPPDLDFFCAEVKAFYVNVLKSSWVRERSIIVSYEELVSDPQNLFNRTIFAFFGLPATRISNTTKKQNTKSVCEIVSRYEEIKNLLNNDSFKQNYSFSQSHKEAIAV